MAQTKRDDEALLKELIKAAERLNVEVRTEKLLREVGYRVRSGRCRVKEQDLIILDRDAPVGDQVDFLAAELGRHEAGAELLPEPLKNRLKK